MTEKQVALGVEWLEFEFGKDRVRQAIDAVKNFKVEIPSWIFGKFGGGRFGDYMPPGAAVDIFQKLDDAAFVHKLTGATDQVAMHVLWDFTKDGLIGDNATVKIVDDATRERGLKIGSISPTYFLYGSHRGSLSATETDTMERYVDQTIWAGDAAKEIGSNLVTLWLPDGSMYPGQVQLRKTMEITNNAIQKAHAKIAKDVLLLIEYKVFEPGTYSTVLSDWGSAYMIAKNLGENAGVLVDMGHHFHSQNIEQIVARLVAEEMKCGFHFNTRYAADDDHAVEPNPEMARIFYELVNGGVVNNADVSKNWAYMIDQCSARENRIHAILHSVDTLQHCLAKAMLVDTVALEELQAKDEIILANRLFNDALLYADVRPIVAAARMENELPLDPVVAFVESDYQEKIEKERV